VRDGAKGAAFRSNQDEAAAYIPAETMSTTELAGTHPALGRALTFHQSVAGAQ